jgi:hypothetical protein
VRYQIAKEIVPLFKRKDTCIKDFAKDRPGQLPKKDVSRKEGGVADAD